MHDSQASGRPSSVVRSYWWTAVSSQSEKVLGGIASLASRDRVWLTPQAADAGTFADADLAVVRLGTHLGVQMTMQIPFVVVPTTVKRTDLRVYAT